MKRGETVTTPQKRKNIAMEGEKQTQPAFTCSRLKIETLEQNLKKKKTLWPLFYGWGSTASRLQPLRGGSLLFTIQGVKYVQR